MGLSGRCDGKRSRLLRKHCFQKLIGGDVGSVGNEQSLGDGQGVCRSRPNTPNPQYTEYTLGTKGYPQVPESTLANAPLVGTDGNDVLQGTSGNEAIIAGAGNDSITAGAGDDEIFGQAGDDVIAGGAGNDSFVYSRGDGHDTISDGSGEGIDDRLVLEGIDPEDVTLVRNGNHVTLVILESAPGAGDEGSVQLRDQLDEFYGRGIDRIARPGRGG